MRTSTISAAAAGRVAVCTSVMPLSSICHIRDSTRIDSFAAKSRARTRSVSPKATLSAVAGTTFTRVTKLTNSARSRQHHDRIGADVILLAEFLEGAGDIAARQRIEQIDHAGAVGEAQHLPHRVGAHGPAACAIA